MQPLSQLQGAFLLLVKPLDLHFQTVLDSPCSLFFVLYLHLQNHTLRELQYDLLFALAQHEPAFRNLVSQLVQEGTSLPGLSALRS